MPKVITSPIERWPGTVTIADPLTLPQAQAIEAGFQKTPAINDEKRVQVTEIIELKQAAIVACVEKWDLENFAMGSDGKPPVSPIADAGKLYQWIFSELLTVYIGETEVPNAS